MSQGHFLQPMVIILVIGPHPSIPKVKVDAIITVGFFMVHDMVGDGG